MEIYDIIAQAVGIGAMAMNCLSFQQKKQKGILAFQLCGSVLFCINYYMLGAMSGAILNIVGILRALVFMNKEKLRAEHPAWSAAFVAAYLGGYVLVFSVFGKEPTVKNFLVELLPVVGMTLTTLSFRYKGTREVRIFGLINSPLWLSYNILTFSIGAICSEVLNFVSILIGILRHDVKRRKNENSKS